MKQQYTEEVQKWKKSLFGKEKKNSHIASHFPSRVEDTSFLIKE